MSEKRMVYAEDVIQRIRDLAPEILGGWYNPDMENELEQLVCVVENTPKVRQHLPGPRETLWLRNALARCLAWQPARRCMYRVRPLQAHGDCLEQGVEEEKCTMMGS